MQLPDPGVSEPSSTAEAAVRAVTVTDAPEPMHEGVNGGGEIIGMDSNSGEEKGSSRGDEGDKMNSGGNRWPRQETLALLKIRSDMDAVFRDSSLKGPLWDEVSRKLAELGYHRSAKKCKEKFENVYKYHKRTKETRSGKTEGKKTYKFFDQLQALENHQFTVSHHNPTKTQPSLPTNRPNDNTTTISHVTTVPSTNPTVISPSPQPPMSPRTNPPQNNNNNNLLFFLPNINNLFSSTASTSSSTASDEDLEERYRKKRKWKDYFRRLSRQVLAKQEEMQKKFLDAIDKREHERMAQQEAWRKQEMARINREHEILVQERSTAAAKDAAVIAFLQKLAGQQNPTPAAGDNNFLQQLQPPSQPPPPVPVPPPPLTSQVQVQPPQQPPLTPVSNHFEIQKMNNGENGHRATPTSSSRWPNSEVHALIRLRTNLENKYQENGPKAPLWEEISAGMQRLGYNRNAKRCKEKWENINKYFKKMKESNKQRREDSKTCPYFDELDALYREKNKSQSPFGNSFQNMKPNEMMEPLMVQPEQQWRPPSHYEQQTLMEEDANQYKEKEREGEDEDEEDVEDGDSMEEDEEGAGSYEIATNNKLSSVDAV